MTAPYRVLWGWMHEHSRTFDDFTIALAFFRFWSQRNLHHTGAELIGDGYDGDCDEDGYFMCSDGLTEEEREMKEMANGS